MLTRMPWQKITLVGVGLLGGSLGLAIKQRKLAARVEGYVRRPEAVAEAVRLGVVDAATCDLAAAVNGADLVIFCTPIAQMRALSERVAKALSPGAIVTDVGSVKGTVVAELEPVFAAVGATFIGSHPRAGGERMGAAAARADLFNNAVCVVTPTPQTPRTAVVRVEDRTSVV